MSVVFTASTRSPMRSLPAHHPHDDQHHDDGGGDDGHVEVDGDHGEPVAAAAPPGMILLM